MKTLNRRLLVALLLLFLTMGAFTTAFAQITPSQDSYTNTATATTNYGTAATLGVVSSAASIQTTYIKFDLSSIPASYTSANIAKATLKLYVNSVTTAGSFNVDYVNGTWAEKTITSSLVPALGTTIASSVPLTAASANNYVQIDVTSAVGEWLSGAQANDGIALVANSGLSATFDSKENTTQSHPAELDIVFTSGGTISGMTTANGSGLTGGGTSGTLNLALTKSCAAKQVLQWNGSAWVCAAMTGSGSSITGVTAGADLTGGGTSGTLTLSLDTTKVPQLNTANNFTGNQTVTGVMAATSFSGDGTNLSNVNASKLGGHPSSYFANTAHNTFGSPQIFQGNGNSATIGDMGCGTGFVGMALFGGVNCEMYSIMGDNFGNLYVNRMLGGTMRFRENNGDELTIAPGGNITATGSITAASFTGDGSMLSNIATPAGNNFFNGFNVFSQNTVFSGNGEYAVVGNMTCGPNSAGITFQGVDCSHYALLDYNGQTILNRAAGHNMSFREGNGPDQMTFFAGGGAEIKAATGAPVGQGVGQFPTALWVENDSTSPNQNTLILWSPNIGPQGSGLCWFDVTANFFCAGSKSAVVPVDGGSRNVALYAVESPENWFEDYGGGTLVGGSATVSLDPAFVQTVNTGTTYRVFVTPKGNCRGLYVSNETGSSFEVHELGGGQANIEFDYRIIAKRKGYENIRMADKTEAIAAMKQHAQEREAAAKAVSATKP
jgi:hypothetical protein